MSESTFDCYLCGTSNDADADLCTNCGGQLLKLGTFDDDIDDDEQGVAGENEVDELAHMADFEDQPPPKPKAAATKASKNPIKNRLNRSIHTSIEDKRLSDALGLTKEADDDGLDQLNTEVTSIPRARAAENIPVLGTKTVSEGTRTQYVDDDEISTVAYVALAALILITAWFGYDTLFRGSGSAEPDNIAFVDTTTTLPPTTTTEAPDPGFTPDQVNFIFGSAIVRIVPYACNEGFGSSVGDPMPAIAINDRSVLLPSNLPDGTNIVQIVTRTGSTRIGVVSNEGGVPVATSNVLTSRNIEIAETTNDADFYVGYDLESNTVTTAESSQQSDAEITVSSLGALNEVRIGSAVTSAEQLRDIDRMVEFDFELAVRRPETVCQSAAPLFLATPAVEETAEENDTDADLEEIGAG